MKHLINWIEIPALDMDRAKKFYSDIFGGLNFIDYPMPDMEEQYAIFPADDQFNAGALAKTANHKPSSDGITVYLDGGEDLKKILDRVESAGGQVIMPKTFISNDTGYIGLFIDSEGNKIGFQNK